MEKEEGEGRREYGVSAMESQPLFAVNRGVLERSPR
jgi:hypothetical protein